MAQFHVIHHCANKKPTPFAVVRDGEAFGQIRADVRRTDIRERIDRGSSMSDYIEVTDADVRRYRAGYYRRPS